MINKRKYPEEENIKLNRQGWKLNGAMSRFLEYDISISMGYLMNKSSGLIDPQVTRKKHREWEEEFKNMDEDDS